MYNARVRGVIDFGMYLTNYDNETGYNGYRLSQQELQFGLRSIPRITWSSQPVDGYVKFRIPVKLLRPGRMQPYFYGMDRTGGEYPDVTEDTRKTYNGIRKNLLFFALPTQPGNGQTAGVIDVKRYVIGYGTTRFR